MTSHACAVVNEISDRDILSAQEKRLTQGFNFCSSPNFDNTRKYFPGKDIIQLKPWLEFYLDELKKNQTKQTKTNSHQFVEEHRVL